MQPATEKYGKKPGIYAAFSLFLLLFLYLTPLSANQYSGKKSNFKNALTFFKKGDFLRSKKILSKLSEKYPDKALVWFNLGNAEFMLSNFENAIIAYKNVERLKSPLSLPAKIYVSKAQNRLNKCLEAAHTLKSVSTFKMTPGIKYEFNSVKNSINDCLMKIGLYYYKNEAYPESIIYFDTVLDLAQDANAEMMKGLALLKTGDSTTAKASFKKVIKYSDDEIPDDEFKNFAKHFVEEIDDGKWLLTRDYMLRLFMGLGFNSNVYGIGDDDEIFRRASFLFNVDGAYRLISKPSFSSFIYDSFLFEMVFGLSDLLFLENILSFPLIYFKDSVHFKIDPLVNYSFLEDKSFGLKVGSEFLFQYGNKYRFGAFYSYLRDFSLNNTYEYLEGNYQETALFGSYTNHKFILKPGVKLSAEDIGVLEDGPYVLPLANISYGPTLYFNWIISKRLALKINNFFLIRNYDAISSPRAINRSDIKWQGDIRLTINSSNDTGVFINLTTVVNKSNMRYSSIENKNYYQIIAFLGFSWDALK